MKKLFLSILFIGVATYVNAQKGEVAEGKRLWGIFQFSMMQDPDAVKKPSAPKPRAVTGPASTSGFGEDGKADTKVGNTKAATGSNFKPAPKSEGAKPAMTFIDRQLASLKEGMAHIDKALLHEKTKELAETWTYKALYTSTIAAIDTIDRQNSIANQKIAEDAIAKARSLDKKGEEKDNFDQIEGNINVAISSRGVSAYNAKDYATALASFNQLAVRNPQDQMWFLNAGVTANFLGKYQEAVQNFKKVISFNSPDSKDLYGQIISINLEKLKDTTAAFAVITEALVKYPDDASFIGTETDLYISKGDIVKSQESLKKLIAKDPNKSVYQYLMGETYYKQALQLQEERKKIDVKKVKEFDAVSAKMLVLIDKALPFYQKSHELDPKFVSTLETLKQIYGFKNDTTNFNDIKKKLDAIPQK